MLQKIFGESPYKTLLRLIFYSLGVGALLSALGFTSLSFLYRIASWLISLLTMGWGLIFEMGSWIVSGALLVFPIWLAIHHLKRK